MNLSLLFEYSQSGTSLVLAFLALHPQLVAFFPREFNHIGSVS